MKELFSKQRLLRLALGVCVGLGVLAGCILVLIHTLGEHDTLFEGKPIYAWLAQAKSKDPALRDAANLVLNRTIIPRLTRAMFQDTNDSHLRLALVDYLNTLPNVNILYRPADSRRADGPSFLGEFGPAAKAATPALLRALQGPDIAVRAPSAIALGKIQADPSTVIPLLIKYLDDSNIAEAAALGLADYGPSAKAAIPKLMELSKIHDKDLHRAVTLALAKIDPTAAPQAGGR